MLGVIAHAAFGSARAMTRVATTPLAPFVDRLPLPSRLFAAERDGRLTVCMRAGCAPVPPRPALLEHLGVRGNGSGPDDRGRARAAGNGRVAERVAGPVPGRRHDGPAADRRKRRTRAVLSGPERRRAGPPRRRLDRQHGRALARRSHAASYDGWAENIFAPGQPAVFHYPMDQRAALLWYHDHVMGITKLDVYAGLAGLWIVRDERERELGLPEGPPFEVPLLIQDRNFDLDEQGRLTGRLVHKTDPEVMEAFPPFTVVNGKVWPVLDVQPATYRFRVLNGSNARTYRLVLLRDGARNSSGSRRSGPTTGSSAPRSPCRRTGSCSPPPSGPTCSSTSPTSSPGAS